MKKSGIYCKAYPAADLRAYPHWNELATPLEVEVEEGSGDDAARRTTSYYYLQDNYTVTAGIFLDENVAFDQVTDEWKTFCKDVLGFKVPSELKTA